MCEQTLAFTTKFTIEVAMDLCFPKYLLKFEIIFTYHLHTIWIFFITIIKIPYWPQPYAYIHDIPNISRDVTYYSSGTVNSKVILRQGFASN